MIKNHIIYNPVIDWRFDLDKAKGSYLWDKQGNRYIDFSSGWNTANLGWNNEEISNSVVKQAKKNVYAPMWSADEIQVKYAKKLISVLPRKLNCVCRATGGTEANEMALKIARAVTGRSQIVSFAHTYHGQSFGTLALGFVPSYVKAIAPLVPDFIQLDYPKVCETETNQEKILTVFLDKLEKKLKTKKVAAVLTEAGLITGWGSMLIAPKGYLKAVRKLTKEYETLLIVDEVGTGFSRTGKLFAIEHESVVPDIVTLAKGISNGAAGIGAVVTKSKMVEKYIGAFKPTSTFGWTPLGCAAALQTLEIHQRDKTWEEAARKGLIIKKMLKDNLARKSYITNIRGLGLEIAFDLLKNNSPELIKKIVNKCFKKSLHLANAGECIQLMPPLTISNEKLTTGMEILIKVIKNI